MKKILLLGSQHGDEPLGDTLFDYLRHNRPDMLEHVDFLIGNPEAKKRGIRFIESDLNRSYNGKHATFEERRASEILAFIEQGSYDLVLDLHTTTCVQPPCLITASISHPFIDASSVSKIVHMNHDIVRSSLIGVLKTAISIEVNRDEIDQTLLRSLVDDIERFITNRTSETKKEYYEVSALLRKSELSEQEAALLKNFHRAKAGFYPVLVGENSYKKHTDYLGFKAYKV
ncbi:MAG TPA: succinylglutamate desuccinylase/aspartoacylase family protein [Candidatus Saccharimonadales bacterium]